jgi:phosphoribosylanthranilate isomerase
MPVQLMLTVGVRDEAAVDVARRFAPACDFLLLDSPHPDTGVIGATGVTHDWSLSARVIAAVDTPVFLAGGLGPENVEAAIRATEPAGVDSETRTSRDDDRRRKDPVKVREFVRRVRALDT